MTEDSGSEGKSTIPASGQGPSSHQEPTDIPGGADSLSAQRVFKKSSPNGKLTLYLCTRDLIVAEGRIDKLHGVLLVDPEYVDQRKVYGQLTLTFRYGREDEEVMGLKFCNEAVMCIAQLYPPHLGQSLQEPNTPLQDALLKRLGPNAYAFTMEITPLAPPSVQLVPAKEYRGSPIGTSYDVRAYVAERADEKLHKRATVRMGLRVVQRARRPPSPSGMNPTDASNTYFSHSTIEPSTSNAANPSPPQSNELFETIVSVHPTTCIEEMENENQGPQDCDAADPPVLVDRKNNLLKESNILKSTSSPSRKSTTTCVHEFADVDTTTCPAPRGTIVKSFMMSDGRIELEGSLDKSIYCHGESVQVNVQIHNRSHKTIRRIKVFIVQHVDVCMFSNGKFKNVVANIDSKEGFPVSSNGSLSKTYTLRPIKGSTKNWIALEDSYSKSGTSLASTVSPNGNNQEDRNVFAIYVSYYVKIKLIVSVTTSEVALKLPFTLMHSCDDTEYEINYDKSPIGKSILSDT